MNSSTRFDATTVFGDPLPPQTPRAAVENWAQLRPPFVLIDLTAAGPRCSAQLIERLRQLPCPVLGVGPQADEALASACDVRLPDPADAAPLAANIGHSPIAAAVLVQLLRATASLPLEPALLMESLAYSTLQAGPEFQRWLASERPAAATHGDEGPPLLLQRDGERLDITLNRPGNRNAMTVELRDALLEALELVLADDSIGAVRIDARGKCFSTGGELSEFGTAPDPATAHLIRCLSLPGRLLARCAGRVQVRLHGACIGSGIEFPAFSRQLTAAPGSYFQLPELRLGLIPGAGGCVSIARRIGRQRTAWLVLSGKRLAAPRALAWGLIDRIQAVPAAAG